MDALYEKLTSGLNLQERKLMMQMLNNESKKDFLKVSTAVSSFKSKQQASKPTLKAGKKK